MIVIPLQITPKTLLSFKQWCDRNGYMHTGHRTFAAFEKRAKQYESYLATAKEDTNGS